MQPKGTGTGPAPENIEQLRAKLAKAEERVATLESELVRKRQALNRLLSDDLQTSQELAELQEMIWAYHQGLPGDCACDVCANVERSRRELEGLI